MMIRRSSAVLLALAVGACTDARKPADAPPPAGAFRIAAVAQPADPAESAAPAAPQDTMLTAWTTLRMPSESRVVQENVTPEALLRQMRDLVAAQLEEPDASVLPTRMESQAAERAVGFLMHPDLDDGSIRDIEFRIHMRREGSLWRVAGVDRRERCRHGVGEGGRCA